MGLSGPGGSFSANRGAPPSAAQWDNDVRHSLAAPKQHLRDRRTSPLGELEVRIRTKGERGNDRREPGCQRCETLIPAAPSQVAR